MDSKSLAKSKRAHTQHHSKKSHSVHKSKGSGISDKSRNPENQTAVLKTKTPVQSKRVAELPSNWDRYDYDEEELESGLEKASSSQPVDVILPKSKGADYLHLISEAQAESQSKIEIDSDCLSSLDDLLHDEFSHVVGSMISARGEGILSWMEDDNFIVDEDESASNLEPGFLSLNLNALAKALAKVDLHETLYIDADLLPPELCTFQTKTSRDEEPCYSHTTQDTEAVTRRLNEPNQQECSGKINPIVAQGEASLEAEPLDQVKDIPILIDQSGKSSAIETDLDLLLNSSSASNQNSSVQNPSSFDDDLDFLLNSHNGAEPFNNRENISGQKLHPTGFDDELDDLLENTSVSMKPQQNETSSSSSTVGKSKILDEFDSWLDTI